MPCVFDRIFYYCLLLVYSFYLCINILTRLDILINEKKGRKMIFSVQICFLDAICLSVKGMKVWSIWRNKSHLNMLLWRNWLARSAVNRKAGGSSPPRSVLFFLKKIFLSGVMIIISFFYCQLNRKFWNFKKQSFESYFFILKILNLPNINPGKMCNNRLSRFSIEIGNQWI